MKNQGLAYKGSAPMVKHSYKKVDVVNSRGNTVRFKQGGISTSRYYSPSKYKTGTGISKKAPVYKYKSTQSTRTNTFKYTGVPTVVTRS